MPTDDLGDGFRAEDCDCAPTARERRVLWPDLTRRAAIGVGVLGLATLAATAAGSLPRAWADSYPSWDDVQRAKASEAAKAAEITNIQNLINALQADAANKQAAAVQAGADFYAAQQAYFDAAQRAQQLQDQADAQEAKAKTAAQHAGRVASQLYRNGGDDTAMQLFMSGSATTADDILAKLGTMDKLLERNQNVYDEAVAARNSAKSLSDQAKRARDERDRLQQVAQQKMVAAQAASDAAQAALDAQNQHLDDLNAQLAALKDATAATVAGYQAGVEARRQAELQREREAAAAAAAAATGGGGGGGGGYGNVVASGWCRPTGGAQTSGFGPRSVQCSPSYCATSYHYGVDLAPGCGYPIVAAHAGTVVYAGYNGGYGNYIQIDHGGGVETGYGHIVDGGIRVRPGQSVGAGQLIAYVGNTGNSFGCHLHYEIHVNGTPVNPVPFMAARGISV
ncbi:M23 family metallopeptidase [Microbacterium rhizosphaerae]|uniref:M23 family metallopeptidase n=1 Tax=Microbacterium rhizosphaerae TaxID=1678237 RepID=A0ABZ0SK62_9MICO|nr:M23 family metallopeptidase [Microbacterium rhizosphaerae]WPR89786.1 M23 family metallopeptidase [Microbacterium rhizosphaerae]